MQLEFDLIEEENKRYKLLNAQSRSIINSREHIESSKIKLDDYSNLTVNLPTTDKIGYEVEYKKIEYIKWDRNVAEVFLTDKTIHKVRRTVNYFFDELLDEQMFVRIHKSIIINILHIRSVNNEHIKTSKSLSLGKKYKNDALNQIKKFSKYQNIEWEI